MCWKLDEDVALECLEELLETVNRCTRGAVDPVQDYCHLYRVLALAFSAWGRPVLQSPDGTAISGLLRSIEYD
jgi:hypothetical protein